MSTEVITILLSSFVVIGILIYNYTKLLGLPAFIVFMGIGLILGDGAMGGPTYDNPKLTEFLCNMSLNIIIFVGGFNTSYQSIKLAWKEGLVLSTVGVLLTAVILGYFTWWVTGLPLIICILFGAIVSSTDAAVVFSIIESKQIKLKNHTGTILEFESATNDPMALILVTLFTTIALGGESANLSLEVVIFEFLGLLVIGAFAGVLFGFITKWILKRVNFPDIGLVPIFILAMFFIASYSGSLLGGNLLIASYIFGVIAGNSEYKGKKNSLYFTNSLSWLAQALMFLFLGLQIFVADLKAVFLLSILPSLFLIFVARPVAVLACYLPFRKVQWNKRFFISFIGLKGATPIVFAFIPLMQGVAHSETLFDMVFYVVMFSVIIQGTLLKPAAKWLKLLEN
jgi:cell volume regulation protein A